MSEKLSWEEIKQRFDREWVELVNYEWSDPEEYPQAGVVRVHAKTRAVFNEAVAKLPPADSAILFVGKTQIPDDIVFNAGLRRTI